MNFGDRLVKVVSPFVCVTIVITTIFILDKYYNLLNGWSTSRPHVAAGFSSEDVQESPESAEMRWLSSGEADAKAKPVKDRAWDEFNRKFPNDDKNQLVAQVYFDEKRNATAEMFFKEGPGSLQSVFGSDRRYWSDRMKTALGLAGVSGFPYELSPLKTKIALQIPAIDFTETVSSSLGKLFSGQMKIYATPDLFFTIKFRNIFQQTRLTHTASSESKNWLGGPKIKYWPQQLNFAVFCATQGCGISREIFDSGLSLTPQIRAFYQFHVYFTIRRILFQMGGIQSMSALPGDLTFNQFNNHYDVASYKRICAEFGIDSSSDFRFTHGKNHGLGRVNGEMELDFKYPGWMKFSHEGGKAIDGNMISYIRPDRVAAAQYDWFAPKTASGLTQAGLSRINQSIEAFVYCILGAQVNIRSSIRGEGGRAKEAQTEFLTLMENAIRQPDLAQSVQRYQLAVDQAKVRLNLAVCPGAWLMPARMVINTESTVGYNDKLKQGIPGMKLGVNDAVNPGTKKAGLQLMEGAPPKIDPPNSHPSNPIHKAAQEPKKAKKSPTDEVGEIDKTVSEKTPQHEINKTAVIIGVFGGVALLFIASR